MSWGGLGVERVVIDSDTAAIDAPVDAGSNRRCSAMPRNSEILAHADLQHAKALIVTLPDESAAAITIASARSRAPRAAYRRPGCHA